jgi:hypothetical protein
MTMTPEQKGSYDALTFIMPELEKRGLRWLIGGGFACYVYGIPRKLTDIDIDIDTSKDAAAFKDLLATVDPYITQPLIHFVDQNHDNYNFEITVAGQLMDICPMAEVKVFDRNASAHVAFYEGFPATEEGDFFGLKLPLLSKQLIIKGKEMYPWQRETDLSDITGLRALLARGGA